MLALLYPRAEMCDFIIRCHHCFFFLQAFLFKFLPADGTHRVFGFLGEKVLIRISVAEPSVYFLIDSLLLFIERSVEVCAYPAFSTCIIRFSGEHQR